MFKKSDNIDVNRIAKELHLENEGVNQGKRNSPETSATGLDVIEQQIVTRIEEIRSERLKYFRENKTVYKERIERDIRPGVQKRVNTAQADFKAYISSIWGNELSQSREHLRTVSREYDNFRSDNQLTRTVHEGGGFLHWFAFFLSFLIFESVLNGFFFADAHEMGIAGGVTIAIGISIVNVGFASVAGYLARNFNHVNLWRKGAGIAIFLVTIIFTASFNFFVAHFRDAMAHEGATWDKAAGQAIDYIFAGQVFPESIDAWLLALLGLLMAGLAGWKAYSGDDPYPGYGKVWRKKEEAQQSHNELPDKLTDERDDVLEKLDSVREDVEDRIEDANVAIHELDLLHGQFQTFLEQCNQKMNLLLAIYRDANKQERSTPPPQYFSENSTLPPINLELEPIQPPPLTELHTLIDKASESILAAFEKATGSFNGNDVTV